MGREHGRSFGAVRQAVDVELDVAAHDDLVAEARRGADLEARPRRVRQFARGDRGGDQLAVSGCQPR
jgi:hypothetical protein